MNQSAPKQLPPWFTKPFPAIKSSQRGLFEAPLASLLPSLHVSIDELIRWRQMGWISFDPSAPILVDELGDPTMWEILFVRDIVRFGFSDPQIAWLLSRCPKPFAFNPDLVAFSFAHGWVEAIPPTSPGKVIDEHLDAWLERCPPDRLNQVSRKIRALRELGDDEDKA